MRALFSNINPNYILFSICLLSRLFTSIYYIEDIDSLRFAYSIVDEYNILKLQPHFPGYAIFCFTANILYSIFGNLGIAFSIIGGISTYFIIFYCLKILDFTIYSPKGLFTIFLILLNPMIWLMGNRYMPDLMGLSFVLASFYYLSSSSRNSQFIGAFLFGLLAGIRLSYIPLLLFPLFLVIIKNKSKLLLIISATIGILIWLIPMIFITGFDNLYIMATKHTIGHFNEYGGTIITENNWNLRLKYFFHTLWSDGFGAYWTQRSVYTLILSLLLIPILLLLFKKIKYIIQKLPTIKVLLISTIIYLLWILFFQNIIYKSRHIMPIVIVLIILLSLAFKHFIYNKNKYYKIYMLSLIISMGIVSINLTIQHKKPTAIKQLSDFLTKNNKKITIISMPLINYYLKSQNVAANYIDLNNSIDNIVLEDSTILKEKIVIVGNFTDNIHNLTIQSDTLFQHNPYVNRMWSTINLFSNKEL